MTHLTPLNSPEEKRLILLRSAPHYKDFSLGFFWINFQIRLVGPAHIKVFHGSGRHTLVSLTHRSAVKTCRPPQWPIYSWPTYSEESMKVLGTKSKTAIQSRLKSVGSWATCKTIVTYIKEEPLNKQGRSESWAEEVEPQPCVAGGGGEGWRKKVIPASL